MQRKASRTRMASRTSSRNQSNMIRIAAIAGGSLLALAACVGAFTGFRVYQERHHEREVDRKTACLLNSDTPKALLVMIDTTDPLTRESLPRLKTAITDTVSALPRYSRVTLVSFGNRLADPLTVKFDGCLPGQRDDAGWDEGGGYLEHQHHKFEVEVQRVVQSLEKLPPANSSPIAEQVIRAASDRVLHWKGSRRGLLLVTDGLQTSMYVDGQARLPAVSSNLLKGVEVEFFEVGNARDQSLQTPSMRTAWADWFKSAGATVTMSAPGYPALTERSDL